MERPGNPTPGGGAGVFALLMGEEVVEIISAIATLVVIGRFYGSEGLGIYSFLLSVFIIASHLSEIGVRKYVEREMALGGDDPKGQMAVVTEGYRAAVTTGLLSGGVLVPFGLFHISRARIGEMPVSYYLITAAIVINNYNGVRKAALHGLGRHDTAARISLVKHVSMVAFIFLLSMVKVPASLLVLGFLAAEVAAAATGTGLPRFSPSILFTGWRLIPGMVKRGAAEIFTDETFRVVFYLDFFILGIFVPAWELGVYSKASVLARLFLIIPLGAAPVFRQRFLDLAAQGMRASLPSVCRRTAGRLFVLHSLLGLYILLYYPQVVNFLFGPAVPVSATFKIFSILMPGLLFFGSASVLEALYQVEGKSAALSRIALGAFLLNGFLNLYLIPYAGHYEAASATTISLLAYFAFFGAGLEKELQLPRFPYILAGGLVYLCYQSFAALEAGMLVTMVSLPAVLVTLLLLSGFFSPPGEEAAFSGGMVDIE